MVCSANQRLDESKIKYLMSQFRALLYIILSIVILLFVSCVADDGRLYTITEKQQNQWILGQWYRTKRSGWVAGFYENGTCERIIRLDNGLSSSLANYKWVLTTKGLFLNPTDKTSPYQHYVIDSMTETELVMHNEDTEEHWYKH